MASTAAKRVTAPATPEKATRSAPLAAPVGLAVDEDDPVLEAEVAIEEDFDPAAVVDAGLDEEAPVADVAPPPRGAVERPSIWLWTVALKVPFMPFRLDIGGLRQKSQKQKISEMRRT